MIELKNVSKGFGSIQALKDISFRLAKEERLVIAGHSGCGKTTLLRVIAGFEKIDSGEICLNGRLASSAHMTVEPVQRKAGMVFQDLALWPHLTVFEHLDFGLENVFRDKKARSGKINEILKMVELSNKMRSLPRQLSGGEKQRLALARALVAQPEILLLDEPFTNLDFELEEKMVMMLLKFAGQFRMTLIYVTHDRLMAKRIGQKTIHLNEGRIVEAKF